MGLDDLFRVFSGHHGNQRGSHHGGHHDDYDNHRARHYGHSDQCGVNAPGQSAPTTGASWQSCPKCAEMVQVGFKFCPSCGASIGPAICKSCAEKLPPAAVFCPGCGTKIQG